MFSAAEEENTSASRLSKLKEQTGNVLENKEVEELRSQGVESAGARSADILGRAC
jgi:hypothetical protein